MPTYDDVVEALYSGPPDRFVADRDAAARAAKADGDRELAAEIAALRKPTVAAWLVNLLMRDDPDLPAQLVALGEGLREAERSLDGAGLRDLSKQRRALVSSLVARAKGLARPSGVRVGDAAAQEVDETLTAALADPDAARAVTSGRLTGGLQYAGFGAADPGAAGPVSRPGARPSGGGTALKAVTDTDSGSTPGTKARGTGKPEAAKATAPPAEPAETPAERKARREAEQRAREADKRRRAAEDEWQRASTAYDRAQADADRASEQRDERQADVADAERAAREAHERHDELAAALTDIRRRLARAEKDADVADRRVTRTTSALHDDERAVVAAQHALRRAQKDLDAAERARAEASSTDEER